MVNSSVSIFSAAGVSDLMTGELSVAVVMGKWSENMVEMYESQPEKRVWCSDRHTCHKVDVVLRTVMRVTGVNANTVLVHVMAGGACRMALYPSVLDK